MIKNGDAVTPIEVWKYVEKEPYYRNHSFRYSLALLPEELKL